jgi:hypothetical protein
MTKRSEHPSRQLPVPVGAPLALDTGPAPGRKPAGSASFAAQLFGQPGRKRGLKGGPPVLTEARAAYLEAEYSGPFDRRGHTGQITKTKV